MVLRVIAWNVNHRARGRAIHPNLVEAIASLNPDVIVLNEYVHRDTRRQFFDQLTEHDLRYQLVSHVTPHGENHVLIASRSPIELGSIRAPGIEKSIPSNFLHVRLPQDGCEILGLRIPDYSKQPKMKRTCWDWIIEMAATAKDRPFVMIGDFNTDPEEPSTLCRACVGKLTDDGWKLATPKQGASWWSVNGKPFRIDHAFVSRHLNVLESRYVAGFGELGSIGNDEHSLSDHAPLLIEIEQRK
jgi:endonuclease/exonuclease/phosphatase family metal-dependent hydrolase